MWEAKNSDYEETYFEVFVHYKVPKSAVPKALGVVQYTFCLPGIFALPEIVVSKEQCVVAEKGSDV
jgi:hypothetical protein